MVNKKDLIFMSESAIISIIRKFALKNSEKDDIHGFLHVERVYKTCINIGNRLGANILVLKIRKWRLL